MATQHDLARETGLSQTTISRVLRGDPAVTAETRARVVAASRKLGYRPSVGARMLVRGRSAVIGLSLSARALPTDRYVSVLHQSLAFELASSGWGARLISPEALSGELDEIGALVLIGGRGARPAHRGLPRGGAAAGGDRLSGRSGGAERRARRRRRRPAGR